MRDFFGSIQIGTKCAKEKKTPCMEHELPFLRTTVGGWAYEGKEEDV